MKLGDYEFKRRYTLAQVIVDIVSFGVLAFIFYIVYICAVDIEQVKSYNVTDTSLEFLNWKPLIVWCVLGLVIFILSFLFLFLPRKKPEKRVITEKYAAKYCNIIDACISCLRLVALLVISELCYLHMCYVMQRESGFSVQLILYAIIAALLVWFTAVRLSSLSEVAERESKEEKTRQIVEN